MECKHNWVDIEGLMGSRTKYRCTRCGKTATVKELLRMWGIATDEDELAALEEKFKTLEQEYREAWIHADPRTRYELEETWRNIAFWSISELPEHLRERGREIIRRHYPFERCSTNRAPL